MRDEGILACCLVEAEPAAELRRRRAWRQALLVSAAIQAAVLCALVLVPLFRVEGLPRLLLVTPSPPYRTVAPHR